MVVIPTADLVQTAGYRPDLRFGVVDLSGGLHGALLQLANSLANSVWLHRPPFIPEELAGSKSRAYTQRDTGLIVSPVRNAVCEQGADLVTFSVLLLSPPFELTLGALQLDTLNRDVDFNSGTCGFSLFQIVNSSYVAAQLGGALWRLTIVEVIELAGAFRVRLFRLHGRSPF